MLRLLRDHPAKAKRLMERIHEGIREIGVLFLAFAPLDVALGQQPLRDAIGVLLFFLTAGALLFAAGLAIEWRSGHDS